MLAQATTRLTCTCSLESLLRREQGPRQRQRHAKPFARYFLDLVAPTTTIITITIIIIYSRVGLLLRHPRPGWRWSRAGLCTAHHTPTVSRRTSLGDESARQHHGRLRCV